MNPCVTAIVLCGEDMIMPVWEAVLTSIAVIVGFGGLSWLFVWWLFLKPHHPEDEMPPLCLVCSQRATYAHDAWRSHIKLFSCDEHYDEVQQHVILNHGVVASCSLTPHWSERRL